MPMYNALLVNWLKLQMTSKSENKYFFIHKRKENKKKTFFHSSFSIVCILSQQFTSKASPKTSSNARYGLLMCFSLVKQKDKTIMVTANLLSSELKALLLAVFWGIHHTRLASYSRYFTLSPVVTKTTW